MKDKQTATGLSIVLGGLGVHKFYFEQHAWGLVYLAFCWTLVPAVLGVAEGARLLRMTDEEFYQRYNAPSLPTRLPEGLPIVPGLAAPKVEVVVNNAVAADAATRIGKLHELLVAGALTPEEFEQQKARILAEGDG